MTGSRGHSGRVGRRSVPVGLRSLSLRISVINVPGQSLLRLRGHFGDHGSVRLISAELLAADVWDRFGRQIVMPPGISGLLVAGIGAPIHSVSSIAPFG